MTDEEHDETTAVAPAPGSEIELTLSGIGHGGVAVGRHDGFVHFVPGGAPGERVRVVARDVRRSFARSELVEILHPAAERIAPRCAFYDSCGGCHWQHVDAPTQRAGREQVLHDLLERVAKVRSPAIDPIVTGDAWAYRHRVTLHAHTDGTGAVAVGYVSEDGRALTEIDGCPIAHPRVDATIGALADAAERASDVNGDVEIRTGHPARTVHVYLQPGTESLATPLLQVLDEREERGTFVFWNEGRTRRSAPSATPPPIVLETPWASWRLPSRAFYQVNPPLAVRLAEHVAEWAALTPRDRAVDLFAGVGFLAAAFAGEAARVWCLEGSEAAVRAGEAAIRRAGIGNVRFVPGPVERLLPTMNFKGSLALAVVDPPRSGLPLPVVASLDKFAPERIIYVSCEPGTLARDIARLRAGGYRHVRSVPFDFFPQTYHFESVTLLDRAR